MIINCLGFIDDRLYMHSVFLANKPVDRLFCADTEAHHFNDDALGKCLRLLLLTTGLLSFLVRFLLN